MSVLWRKGKKTGRHFWWLEYWNETNYNSIWEGISCRDDSKFHDFGVNFSVWKKSKDQLDYSIVNKAKEKDEIRELVMVWNFRFYSTCNGKPWKGFNHKRYDLIYIFKVLSALLWSLLETNMCSLFLIEANTHVPISECI